MALFAENILSRAVSATNLWGETRRVRGSRLAVSFLSFFCFKKKWRQTSSSTPVVLPSGAVWPFLCFSVSLDTLLLLACPAADGTQVLFFWVWGARCLWMAVRACDREGTLVSMAVFLLPSNNSLFRSHGLKCLKFKVQGSTKLYTTLAHLYGLIN